MILHTIDRLGPMPQPFNGLVVEIDAVYAHLARQGVRIDGESVVLRGDFHAAGLEIFHRLVAAPVAELQLERLATQREAKDLMAQANPENGNPRFDQVADGLNGVTER